MTPGISKFEKNLTLWVLLCMIIGVLIAVFIPIIPQTLEKFEYYSISIPMAILIFIMIFPMMLKVDFGSVKQVSKNPQGLYVTWFFNWVIKPFTMFAIAVIFFQYIYFFLPEDVAVQMIAGAVLLGAAPCTAMVFVWSRLVKGNHDYTVVQVATNDLIILFLYAPIVSLLLGTTDILLPYNTLLLSIVLFVVVPLLLALLVRKLVIKRSGIEYFENTFTKKFDNSTMIALLLTLTLIFSFQGDVILSNPVFIVLIAIPLILQTLLIYGLTFSVAKKMKIPFDIAAPCALIATSNFFELAVAVAIVLFGVDSIATLTTIVGVLVEVPLMLFLVKLLNKRRY